MNSSLTSRLAHVPVCRSVVRDVLPPAYTLGTKQLNSFWRVECYASASDYHYPDLLRLGVRRSTHGSVNCPFFSELFEVRLLSISLRTRIHNMLFTFYAANSPVKWIYRCKLKQGGSSPHSQPFHCSLLTQRSSFSHRSDYSKMQHYAIQSKARIGPISHYLPLKVPAKWIILPNEYTLLWAAL